MNVLGYCVPVIGQYCNNVALGANSPPVRIAMETWIIYVLFLYVRGDEP